MKTKCPNCDHEFDIQLHAFSDRVNDFYNPMEIARRRFPNGEIPPYPHGATGDSMPYLIECKGCAKLDWSLCSYDRVTGYLCHECYQSSNQTEKEET